jgi:hypothetical protein
MNFYCLLDSMNLRKKIANKYKFLFMSEHHRAKQIKYENMMNIIKGFFHAQRYEERNQVLNEIIIIIRIIIIMHEIVKLSHVCIIVVIIKAPLLNVNECRH